MRNSRLIDMLLVLAKNKEALSPRELEMIKLRYGICNKEPLTLAEVGRVTGYSRERVRQIVTKAEHRLLDLI